jgi:hypothetical protein
MRPRESGRAWPSFEAANRIAEFLLRLHMPTLQLHAIQAAEPSTYTRMHLLPSLVCQRHQHHGLN